MRILHAITGLYKASGMSVFCVELCNHLRGAGAAADIAVVDPSEPDLYRPGEGVRLLRLGDALGGGAGEWDAVHIHGLWRPALHRAAVWARRRGLPAVWSPHGMLMPWSLSQKKWKKRAALRLYQFRDLRKAALIHVTALSEEEDIRRIGLGNRVVEAPLGCTVPQNFGKRGMAREGGKRRILFLSRIHKKKGLLNLAEAWAGLREKNPRLAAGWEIVIAGPDQEGHSEEVRRRAEALAVSDSFVMTGPVFGEEKERLYDSADLFVLPTHSENFGSVVIEALSHGVPVITTKGAPWRELEERRCGWWIDIGAGPLEAALRGAVALGDAERGEMGRRGRALVEERYAWPAIAEKMKAAYEGLLP